MKWIALIIIRIGEKSAAKGDEVVHVRDSRAVKIRELNDEVLAGK